MKILKRAIGTTYEFTCWRCKSILEAEESDVICRYTDGSYTFHCPVCDKDVDIDISDIKANIIYENEQEP